MKGKKGPYIEQRKTKKEQKRTKIKRKKKIGQKDKRKKIKNTNEPKKTWMRRA